MTSSTFDPFIQVSQAVYLQSFIRGANKREGEATVSAEGVELVVARVLPRAAEGVAALATLGLGLRLLLEASSSSSRRLTMGTGLNAVSSEEADGTASGRGASPPSTWSSFNCSDSTFVGYSS